jgi:hypothetical protein
MKFRARKRLRFGPIVVNLTQRGISSISLRFWRWSYNFRTGKHTFDTPGLGYVQSKGRRR